jgi:hypothetical protein
MKKLVAIVFGLALCWGVFAAVETVEIGQGGSWESPGCRALAVRAVSSVAAGTANVVGVYTYAVLSNVTETVVDTEVLWRRVLTNSTQTVTNTYSGQVVYTPPPPWKLATEGWITNTTERTVTRTVATGDTLTLTNTIGSVTCSGGLGYAAPSGAGAYIAPGEKVGWSGTAKGRVWLFIER